MASRPRRELIPPAPQPWTPPFMSQADAYAIRALHDGVANEGQQKRAWDFIMSVCGVRDLEFRPDSQRASDFAGGKRFVGLQLVKPVAMPSALLDKLPQ